MLVLTYGVTYWDYLGWTDTFGDPEFTKRQREYRDAFGAPNIYTPQIVLSGTTHSSRYSKSDVAEMALPKTGVGLSFTTADDGSVWALVLQDGIDTLWRGQLSTGIADVVPLIDAPVGIGDLQDGRFYIAHDNALGLISLYDPSDDSFVEVGGFALANVLNDPEPLMTEEQP